MKKLKTLNLVALILVIAGGLSLSSNDLIITKEGHEGTLASNGLLITKEGHEGTLAAPTKLSSNDLIITKEGHEGTLAAPTGKLA